MNKSIVYTIIAIGTGIVIGGSILVGGWIQEWRVSERTHQQIAFREENAVKEDVVLYQIPLTGIKRLEADFITEDVEVRVVEGQTDVLIEHKGDVEFNQKHPIEIRMSGSTLHIKRERTLWETLMQLKYPNSTAVISIPASSLLDYDMSNVSGSVKLTGLESDKLEIESVSGRVYVEDVAVETLSIDTVSGGQYGSAIRAEEIEVQSISGDQRFEQMETYREIEAGTVSGDCTLVLKKIPEKIEIGTVSGDASINMMEEVGVEVAYCTVSGNFKTNIPFEMTEEEKMTKEGVYLEGTHEIGVETVSGDCEIYFVNE